MHHKYAVRDGAAVWTGSANWTIDSWTRQENVLAVIESEPVARAYQADFEELWSRQSVEHSGAAEPEPATVDGAEVRAWFTPGHGPQLSQRIATAIGSARRRVRVASPVITSAPVLGTLAELAGKGGLDVAGVVDGPQVATVFQQWAENGHSAWKIPLLAATLSRLAFSAKPSTPWTPDSLLHDFMHAKVTVADDTAFFGSFNLSRSGELNAENVIEVQDSAIADQLAGFVDEVRGRYPPATIPDHSAAITASSSSASSA
jgi:phosphatidylserine/phosphatidylglycerophosphate/cardiolipin synthase-like enzyme